VGLFGYAWSFGALVTNSQSSDTKMCTGPHCSMPKQQLSLFYRMAWHGTECSATLFCRMEHVDGCNTMHACNILQH